MRWLLNRLAAALAPNTEGEQHEEPVLCGSCFLDTHNCQGVALRDMNVNLGTVPCECPTCCAIAEAPDAEGEGRPVRVDT